MAGRTLDMRGRTISTFIAYHAATALKDMDEGETLEIVADDYEPVENDINAWCRMTGHTLVRIEPQGDSRRYVIRKAPPAPPPDRALAVVISNPGLEELLSPLGFTLAAALTGADVHIYFQGPAVKVLARGFKETLTGPAKPFSAFARRGLAKAGHIAPQEKLAQLRELGARLYVCGPSMDHFGVRKDRLIFDDPVIAEYITFMEAMNKADIHIYA